MTTETERADFETWAIKTHGRYTLSDPDCGGMWSAWQAGRASIPADEARAVLTARGSYTQGELRELAELPDAALAAAFRDVAACDYSKCWASLFRAHVIEKAREVLAAPAAQDKDADGVKGLDDVR